MFAAFHNQSPLITMPVYRRCFLFLFDKRRARSARKKNRKKQKQQKQQIDLESVPRDQIFPLLVSRYFHP